MGNKLQLNNEGKPAQRSLREQFGKSLVELGAEHPEMVVLDVDLSSSTKTQYFGKEFPNRFFNIGIAEQNLLGIAMGFAITDKIPFVSGFTCFTVGRAWDFIRTASMDKLPVKICTTHAGLSDSRDGATHQAIEDLALMASIPNMTVFAPCDPTEVAAALQKIIKLPGTCYLRLMRNALPRVWPENYQFSEEFIELLHETTPEKVQITIISTGSMTCFTPQIIELLAAKKYSVRVIHIGQIKPLNSKSIIPYCNSTDVIITLEEHTIQAGFGAQLARVIGEHAPKPILVLGISDRFGQTGSNSELYREYGLDPESITAKIIDFWNHTKNTLN